MQPESVGQHDPNWPVMHQGDYLVIHFQSPIESSINLQEGDCFFSVTGPEEHGGGLLFNYKKHEQVIKKVIPPDDLGHAFSEDYLDKLLSESGSTISSFNIIVVTASKQTKRVSLAEFALCPQEPTGDVVQDASNQERQNVSELLLDVECNKVLLFVFWCLRTYKYRLPAQDLLYVVLVILISIICVVIYSNFDFYFLCCHL